MNQYQLFATLNAGEQTVVLNYAWLNLVNSPAFVRIDGPVTKTEPGQTNLYASFIDGSATPTQAQCELNAPCDVTGRKVAFTVGVGAPISPFNPVSTPLSDFREVIRL